MTKYLVTTCRNDGSSHKEIVWSMEGLTPRKDDIKRAHRWFESHKHNGNAVFDYEVIEE